MASEEQKRKNLEAMSAMMRSMVRVGPQARAPLTDIFSLAQITPNISEWYFCAKCEECRAISPIFSDPFNGERQEFFSGEGGFRFNCHFCQSEILVLAPDIFPFQWMG